MKAIKDKKHQGANDIDTSGGNSSPWLLSDLHRPHFPVLSENIQTDVCIVGGGLAGLTTAYLLAKAGRSVVVLEDGMIGSGETGRTTAHLVTALDDRYYELERLHGERGAQLAAESHVFAIDQIEAIAAEERIDCDFERLDGYLFLSVTDTINVLEKELEAAHRAGLTHVRMLERAPIADFDTGPCLHFPQQGQFHPLKYLCGLARAITRYGGLIFENSHAQEIEEGDLPQVTVPSGHTVSANQLVIATNAPVISRVHIPLKQVAYRSYVIGIQVPCGTVAKALFWDTGDSYHYVRVQSAADVEGSTMDTDLLIVGGEDHKTGQDEDIDYHERYERLETWTRSLFPMAQEVEFRWSGQIMEPVDRLAFIGKHPLWSESVYIATGDSGNGMTYGTIAGVLLSSLILGQTHPWETLYSPSRLSLMAVPTLVKEAANFVPEYGAWLTAGDVETPESIPRGTGCIVREGLMKFAYYRDDEGTLHKCSAVCPHLGGIVNWNAAEKTWDCPLHGSRFDPLGEVLNGPANNNLKRE